MEQKPLGVIPSPGTLQPAAPVGTPGPGPVGVINQPAVQNPANAGPGPVGTVAQPGPGVLTQPVNPFAQAQLPPVVHAPPVNPFPHTQSSPAVLAPAVNPFAHAPAPGQNVQATPVNPFSSAQAPSPAVVDTRVVNPFPQKAPTQRPVQGRTVVPNEQFAAQRHLPQRILVGNPAAAAAAAGGAQIPLPPGGPPDPEAIAFVGRFGPWPWRQYPDEAYLAEALERMGKRVVRINQDHPQAPLPPALWVVCTAYPSSMEKIERWYGQRNTILWTLDWLLHDELRRPCIDAARTATLFASSDEWDWKAHGIGKHFYLPGACEGIPVGLSPRPSRKCAFMGSLYSERRKRIAHIVRSMGGTVLDHPGAWLYGQDLARFVQDTKVIVGDNTRNDVQGYWSSRNYVIPGAGGFLLTPRVPGIQEQFTPDTDIALYDSLEELPEKIEWWASHDAERERIRITGFHHVRTNHNWTARAGILLAAVGRFART